MTDAMQKATALKKDIQSKIAELGKLVYDNRLSISLNVCDTSFYVFDNRNYDEEDAEYYREEYGLENGMWYSSSQMC